MLIISEIPPPEKIVRRRVSYDTFIALCLHQKYIYTTTKVVKNPRKTKKSAARLACNGLNTRVIIPLQPLLELEEPEGEARDDEHQRDSPHIAVLPTELGHKLEVHAVHARNKRRGHEDNSGHRENLDYLVLLDIDKAKCRILNIVQTLEAEIGMADKRVHVFEHQL